MSGRMHLPGEGRKKDQAPVPKKKQHPAGISYSYRIKPFILKIPMKGKRSAKTVGYYPTIQEALVARTAFIEQHIDEVTEHFLKRCVGEQELDAAS
jgi:hypothetical protein